MSTALSLFIQLERKPKREREMEGAFMAAFNNARFTFNWNICTFVKYIRDC